ncbi:MAG: type VI secretion system protein TssA [Pseudomonadota bacterium]
MPIEIEKLLTAIAPDLPCGQDIEYDPDFMALEQLARGKPEQQVGDSIKPAEEPEWGAVRRQAEALFVRTKDVRIAMLLIRSLIRTEQIVGFGAGLALMQELLGRYWNDLHPRLDADEDNDPTMRLNALAPLADTETLLRDVRNAFFVSPGPYGRVTVRDVLAVLGKLPSSEGALTQASLEGIIRAANAQNAVPVDAVKNSLQSVIALQSLFAEKVGSDKAPDLKPLIDIFKAMVQVCDTVLGFSETGVLASAEAVSTVAGDTPLKMNDDIRSREDAVRMLNRVCEFIERTEPANPAPLFIRRGQQLMTKTFVEIIQDLAPDSLSQIQKMAGLDRQ